MSYSLYKQVYINTYCLISDFCLQFVFSHHLIILFFLIIIHPDHFLYVHLMRIGAWFLYSDFLVGGNWLCTLLGTLLVLNINSQRSVELLTPLLLLYWCTAVSLTAHFFVFCVIVGGKICGSQAFRLLTF